MPTNQQPTQPYAKQPGFGQQYMQAPAFNAQAAYKPGLVPATAYQFGMMGGMAGPVGALAGAGLGALFGHQQAKQNQIRAIQNQMMLEQNIHNNNQAFGQAAQGIKKNLNQAAHLTTGATGDIGFDPSGYTNLDDLRADVNQFSGTVLPSLEKRRTWGETGPIARGEQRLGTVATDPTTGAVQSVQPYALQSIASPAHVPGLEAIPTPRPVQGIGPRPIIAGGVGMQSPPPAPLNPPLTYEQLLAPQNFQDPEATLKSREAQVKEIQTPSTIQRNVAQSRQSEAMARQADSNVQVNEERTRLIAAQANNEARLRESQIYRNMHSGSAERFNKEEYITSLVDKDIANGRIRPEDRNAAILQAIGFKSDYAVPYSGKGAFNPGNVAQPQVIHDPAFPEPYTVTPKMETVPFQQQPGKKGKILRSSR